MTTAASAARPRSCSLTAGTACSGRRPPSQRHSPAVTSSSPDAVLLDVRLPDGDGVTLAETLRARPDRPRVLLTSTDRQAVSPDAVAPQWRERLSPQGRARQQRPGQLPDDVALARSVRERYPGGECCARASVRAAQLKRSFQRSDPVLEADQSTPPGAEPRRRRCRRREPRRSAVRRRWPRATDAEPCRSGMLDDVRQRLGAEEVDA